MLTKGRKMAGQRRRDELVEDQRDAHAVGADAGGHQFRERQPDADAGAHGVERHEHVEAEGDEPAVARVGHRAENCLLDFQRRGLRGIEIGERILEEGLNLVGGNAAGAGDCERRGGWIVGADVAGGAGEVAIGVDDGEGGAIGLDVALPVAAGCEQALRLGLVEMESQFLVRDRPATESGCGSRRSAFRCAETWFRR